jgi:hypothetical protein
LTSLISALGRVFSGGGVDCFSGGGVDSRGAFFFAEVDDIVEISFDFGDGLIDAALSGGLPSRLRASSAAFNSSSVNYLTSGSDSSDSSSGAYESYSIDSPSGVFLF